MTPGWVTGFAIPLYESLFILSFFPVYRPANEIVDMIRTGNSKDFDVDRLKCMKKLLPDNNEVSHVILS